MTKLVLPYTRTKAETRLLASSLTPGNPVAFCRPAASGLTPSRFEVTGQHHHLHCLLDLVGLLVPHPPAEVAHRDAFRLVAPDLPEYPGAEDVEVAAGGSYKHARG